MMLGTGGPVGYAPAMMVRVLLYGYATGIFSSRKIQAKTFEDVAFRFLSASEHPDHSTLAEFRKRHLEALAGLFTQALQLCQKAGLVKLGHVAIDGSKLQGNASKHKAMSYGRMGAAGEPVGQAARGQGGVGIRSPAASRGEESGGRGPDRRAPRAGGAHRQEDTRGGA